MKQGTLRQQRTLNALSLGARLGVGLLVPGIVAAFSVFAGCRSGPEFLLTSNPCEPLDGATVKAECGVFVQIGAPSGGAGTQESPYGSIREALEGSELGNVYVCNADDEGFSDALTIGPEIHLYGGLACADWRFDLERRTAWTAPADEIPLKLSDGTGAIIDGFAITAADSAIDGGSSIAILSDGAVAALRRVDIVTGAGGDGGVGVEGEIGPLALGGRDAASGGGGGDSSCGVPGGAGAPLPSDMPGSSGVPTIQSNGGSSGPAMCMVGGAGDPVTGTGALGTHASRGTISTSGYVPTNDGTIGGEGGPGMGGGGGGAITDVGGGGGGGAGGCGGTGGGPGTSAGSSIGIVWLLGTQLTFTDCTAAIGPGGNGGEGGPGGMSSTPGGGGLGINGSCSGGAGSPGQQGGTGGSGAGGDSLVIAYQGSEADPPRLTGLDFSEPSSPGISPNGGNKGIANATAFFE